MGPDEKRNDLPGTHGCKWGSPEAAHGSTLGGGRIDLSWSLGLDDLRTGGFAVTKTTIQGRDAVKMADEGGGGCEIGLAVTGHSRALIIVQMTEGSTDNACDIAVTLAKDAASKLPGGK